MVPITIMRSMGLTRVCGQLAKRAKARRHLPASAMRSSHCARRWGSRASAFTVLMPVMVSPRVAYFQVSAADTRANKVRKGRR